MMTESRKRIMDAFQTRLYQSYQNFCDRHKMEPTAEGLITFLIDLDLIGNVAIKRYTIQQEFEELYPKNQNHKTRTVNTLSDKFNIPERTIWGILKKE